MYFSDKIIGIMPIISLNLHMDLTQSIRSLSRQPLTHQLLSSLLKGYKRPNDKIHELISTGIIEPVKKGLYLPSTKLSETRTEPFLLANHILGPSYVSFDSALSYYGLIPERVFEVSSATIKASRSFNTPTGAFSFTRMPLPYYSFGILQVELGENQNVLIASPEKALFDKIVNTAGLKLRSKIAARDYLIENLRIEEDQLQQLDIQTMETWLTDSPKRESLTQVIKFIEEL
jgi:hypothetical protein